MVLSLLYRLVRGLLGMLILVCRGDRCAARRRSCAGRSPVCDTELPIGWLACLARLVPRRRWAEIFSVTPAAMLAWHRWLVARKWNYHDRCQPGPKPTATGVKTLIVRLAKENAQWGTVASGVSWPASVTKRQITRRPRVLARYRGRLSCHVYRWRRDQGRRVVPDDRRSQRAGKSYVLIETASNSVIDLCFGDR
jgi:hypothetical protein